MTWRELEGGAPLVLPSNILNPVTLSLSSAQLNSVRWHQ